MTATNEVSAPIPSSVTYVAYHAAQRPDAIAVIVNGSEITYQAFYRDIGCFVAALRKLELESGQVVGIEHPHLYLHRLAVFALEALGVTSFSYGKDDVSVLRAELADADMLLCSADGAPDGHQNIQTMDQGWIDEIRRETPENPIRTERLNRETPLRITRSSGTTGSLKCMYHTAAIREFWIENYLFCTGVNRRSRYLMSIGFTIEAMQYYATACVRMGGTCIYDGRTDLADVLTKQNISHVALPTFVLKQLLDGMPHDYVKPKDLTIYLISAAVPPDVRAKVRKYLANETLESYGTSECGGICDMDGDANGVVRPGVIAEVVDDDEQPVFGEVGRVRVRSPGVVDGYIGDPGNTARMFRGDWFYPGDLAIMQDERTLKLVGRADDILNIGGVKFKPETLEEKLRQAVSVTDLCIVELTDDAGLNRLCIVVVPQDGSDGSELKGQLSAHLPSNLGQVELVTAKHIPRTEMGKAKRNELVHTLQRREGAS